MNIFFSTLVYILCFLRFNLSNELNFSGATEFFFAVRLNIKTPEHFYIEPHEQWITDRHANGSMYSIGWFRIQTMEFDRSQNGKAKFVCGWHLVDKLKRKRKKKTASIHWRTVEMCSGIEAIVPLFSTPIGFLLWPNANTILIKLFWSPLPFWHWLCINYGQKNKAKMNLACIRQV